MTLSDAVLGFRARERFLGHLARLDLPARPADLSLVTERDLAALPSPAQRYLRFMGVVHRALENGRDTAASRQPIGCLDPGGEPVEIGDVGLLRPHLDVGQQAGIAPGVLR
jgi:hypothetical protein